jgi:tripartite-type tricarboxylate transporter receptor subunit TctC
MLGSAIISYAPAIKDDLPYKDSDFNHIIFVGTTPQLWITKSDSKIKKVEDMLTTMPEFVGGGNTAGEINFISFKKQKKFNSTYVPFKGSPDILVNILNSTVSAGIMSPTNTLLELQKSGKINIVGSSYKSDVIIDGVDISSVSKRTGVPQFDGFISIATKPNLSPEKMEILKQGLWQALQDNETKDKLKKLHLLSDSSNDQKWMLQHFQYTREQAKIYLAK